MLSLPHSFSKPNIKYCKPNIKYCKPNIKYSIANKTWIVLLRSVLFQTTRQTSCRLSKFRALWRRFAAMWVGSSSPVQVTPSFTFRRWIIIKIIWVGSIFRQVFWFCYKMSAVGAGLHVRGSAQLGGESHVRMRVSRLVTWLRLVWLASGRGRRHHDRRYPSRIERFGN